MVQLWRVLKVLLMLLNSKYLLFVMTLNTLVDVLILLY